MSNLFFFTRPWVSIRFQQAQRVTAISAILAAMMLVVLDAAIVNVALPTVAQALAVSPARSVLIITAYQLALVIALLPCAALGESWGYRRVFTAGVALFTIASAFCAWSPSLSCLVAARFLQGLGGAAIMALGIALMRIVVSDKQLGAAIGWNALVVALSSAAGPSLGALILASSSWPWLFVINIPLGLIVLFATRALPHRAGTARRLDLVSVTLNTSAFAALVIGAELLLSTPSLTVILFGVAVASFIILIRREQTKITPLIPLDLFNEYSFKISIIASLCCFTGQTVALVAFPFYLQHELGQNTMMTGVYLTVWPLTVAITAPLVGLLVKRISTAWLCATGGLCLTLGLAAAALLPLPTTPWPLAIYTMLCGLGFGLFNVSNNRTLFLTAPKERSGAAGGMQSSARLMGQTAGAVIMTLLFTLTDLAPRIGLGIGALLTLAAALVSLLRSEANNRHQSAIKTQS